MRKQMAQMNLEIVLYYFQMKMRYRVLIWK